MRWHTDVREFSERYKQVAREVKRLSEVALIASPPDALHDLRVACRRLQTMSRMLPRKIRRSQDHRTLGAALDSAMKSTSAVRDLDSLVGTLGSDRVAVPAALLVSLRRERGKRAVRARPAIRALLHTRVPSVKPRWLDEAELFKRIEKRISRRSRSVQRSLASVLPNETDTEVLHQLRLQVKKLRYLLEMVKPEPPDLGVFEGWQEKLGNIHDLDVAISYLASHLGPPSGERLARMRLSRHLRFQSFARRCRKDVARLKHDGALCQEAFSSGVES